jgi:GntR family transcriptional regulator
MLPAADRSHHRGVPKIPMSSDQIVEDLAARIKAGEYKPGEQLPTYAVLAGLYDVSPATIAIVIRILRDRGIVVGVRGRGTYVPEAN